MTHNYTRLGRGYFLLVSLLKSVESFVCNFGFLCQSSLVSFNGNEGLSGRAWNRKNELNLEYNEECNLSASDLVEKVEERLNIIYPPSDLEQRIALSRQDGYWKYINNGEEPPLQFTYGEFDISFFAQLLKRSAYHFHEWHGNKVDGNDESLQGWDGRVFVDFGSGTGRLVLAAAALNPRWLLCKGIEILPSIHEAAIQNLEKCSEDNSTPTLSPSQDLTSEGARTSEQKQFSEGFPSLSSTSLSSIPDDILNDIDRMFEDSLDSDQLNISLGKDVNHNSNSEVEAKYKSIHESDQNEKLSSDLLPSEKLTFSPVEYICGSFDDPYINLGDVDCIFCFSSCMDNEIIKLVSKAAGRCRPGTILITTDYVPPLEGKVSPVEDDARVPRGEYKLELLESFDGVCSAVGGMSTGMYSCLFSLKIYNILVYRYLYHVPSIFLESN